MQISDEELICNDNLKKFWYFRFFCSKSVNFVIFAFTFVSESLALLVLTAKKRWRDEAMKR
jgi:hypothetical protein